VNQERKTQDETSRQRQAGVHAPPRRLLPLSWRQMGGAESPASTARHDCAGSHGVV